MIDTHAHLNIIDFNDDLNKVISSAKAENVDKIIVVGIDLKSSIKALEIANNNDGIFAAVGIHPCYVNNSNHLELNYLYENKKVVAVGEIGLDYYHQKDNESLQKQVFEAQILKAIALNLPVIIHIRNSFDDTYEIVKKYKGKLKGVFHCFSSNLEDALKVIELGFYIGIDGPVTFKNNFNLVDIVKNISLENILIETDCPYLAPMPFRGKKNEPKNLKFIAEKIAEIKKITLKEVDDTTTKNAIKLFNIGG